MPEESPLLTICMLGAPRVARGRTALELPHQKAQALLYYLAASQKSYTRDHLAALLWGDVSLNDARHSLRSALYKLRQALRALDADIVLRTDGDRLMLDHRYVECDLIRFQQLIAAGSETDLHTAVGLIRGSFLQDFSIPDSVLFDEFIQQQDAWLTRQRHLALERLATFAEQRGDWEQTIRYLEELTRLDPLDELAHQRLMAAYVRSGAPGLAQRHYQHVERILHRELGIAPADETRTALRLALERRDTRIVAGKPQTPFVRARPMMLPFVGRSALIDRLLEIGSLVAQGSGRVVLIEGEIGIGKSRLVDELLARLAAMPGARMWQIFRGRCSSFDSILAYSAFREAFGHMLPEQATPLAGVEQAGATASDRFAEDVLHMLTNLSQQGPIALAIDDLHAADQRTIRLFGYLAFHLQRLPLFLIGTVQHLGDALLQEIAVVGRRRGDLDHLRVPALSLDAVREILASLGASDTAIKSLAPWLLARSAGTPFIIEALIAQLRSEQLLVADREDMRFDSARWIQWRAEAALPEHTHDLVLLRLKGLGLPARQVVNVLAVAGVRLPLDVIALALEWDMHQVHLAIDELIADRLALEQGDGVMLAHELLREAALYHLNSFAQRCLHRRLAMAWEQHGAATPDVIEVIARHAVAGGDVERAHRYGLALLNDLPYAFAGAETVAFLQRLEALVRDSASLADQRRLAHALGQAHRALGNIEQAYVWHRRQIDLARRAGDSEAQVVGCFELAEAALILNDYEAVIAAADQGLAQLALIDAPQRHAMQGRGYRLIGAARAMEGSDLESAEHYLRAAIEAHEQSGDQTNLCLALFELGNVLAQQGSVHQALDLYRQAEAVVNDGRAPFLQALAANNFAYHNLLVGRLNDAREALDRGRAIAEHHGLLSVLLHLFSTESEICLYVGDWDHAEAACRQGLAIADSLGNLERQAGYQATLALIRAKHGQVDQARTQLEAALQTIAGRTYWHLRIRMLLWLAELLIVQESEDTGACLDTALALARSQRRRLLLLHAERLYALHLARYDRTAAQARLIELIDQAAALDIPLEIARTRAALARVILQHTPHSSSGRALLESARRDLSAFGALAEMRALAL
ncbi:MAG: AAA family ATPase [Roseiflexus sp.]|nr:AAA family ATPase [Roseiflexus sp.]